MLIVINNVTDAADAVSRARLMIDAGEIHAFVFVSDYIDSALRMAGLKKKDLGPIAYYSDWAFVSLFLPEIAPWICHWDAEVSLKEPVDWISPAINLMEKQEEIAVANPYWRRGGWIRKPYTLKTASQSAMGSRIKFSC